MIITMDNKKITTTSGIEIKTLYHTAKPVLENPGEFPFTRGIQKDMYRGRLWTMRQYAGFSTAEESNKRYHYLLKQGQQGFPLLLICQHRLVMIQIMKWLKEK